MRELHVGELDGDRMFCDAFVGDGSAVHVEKVTGTAGIED